MTPHTGYPSDLSDERDERWELTAPVLAARRARRRRDALDIGRPPEHDLRQIMNAILYVDRTGIPWRYLPHDFAPWATTYGYFTTWQQDGVFEQLTGLLPLLVREAEGRGPRARALRPHAGLPDHQDLRQRAPRRPGHDAGKRITGRKRHLGCDTLGLLLTVLVTAASVSDTAAGATLLSRIAAAHPRVTKARVDAGYRTTAINHGARLGIDVHPVQRPPGVRGFTIIARRWTIERSIGWLMHHRRLTRDTTTTTSRERLKKSGTETAANGVFAVVTMKDKAMTGVPADEVAPISGGGWSWIAPDGEAVGFDSGNSTSITVDKYNNADAVQPGTYQWRLQAFDLTPARAKGGTLIYVDGEESAHRWKIPATDSGPRAGELKKQLAE
ncbi:IS5 family transposase [Streptomyces durmitorensis]|uniref:IS5 family transposase n=1 Tax=Streptomyces durmitorensis TaxID=319947 RepID=A0ABY4Q5E2_9ACTN|nr:IS5 family transposase [Streptomyces durmitorensis]UQT61292.1 IS5 family transposase [Streptomyces durmitorensis]